MRNKKYSNILKTKQIQKIGGGVTLKALSAAVLAGCFALGTGAGTAVFADDVVDNNTVLNAATEAADAATGAEVTTPDSTTPDAEKQKAYTITDGTADDYDFTSAVVDENGKVTTTYHKINYEVKVPECDLTLDKFQSAKNVTWSVADAAGDNTVEVTLPNGETKYYQYEYVQPEDYTATSTPVSGNYTSEAVNKVTFRDITNYLLGGGVNVSIESPDINADFVNITERSGAVYVGAGGKVENLTGTFVNNNAARLGSAIWVQNSGTISNLNGTFVGNYNNWEGGAVCNWGAKIGNITGIFIGNIATDRGGAIFLGYEGAIIENINGIFIANQAGSGGAILNPGETMGNITGDFLFNTADGNGGGALYNWGSIGKVHGNFVANHSNWVAGAIHNDWQGSIEEIVGDFIGNSSIKAGGAIYNYDNRAGSHPVIGDITGNFIGNYAQDSYASGGAIYNYNSAGISKLGNINGDFIGNYAKSTSSANGGAISNSASSNATVTIGDITGNIIGNYTHSTSSSAGGGAIYNYGSSAKMGDITGDILGNYAQADTSNVNGGAISNSGTVGDITGDIIGNYAHAEKSYASGGAIYNNYGTIGDITGDIIGNYAQSTGFSAKGGAIYNYARGSAKVSIGDITGDIIGNYAQGGTLAQGGAIYNTGTIGAKDEDDNIVGGFKNVNFINNYAKATSEDGKAQGGAIYTTKDLNFFTDNATTLISGNYVQVGDGEKDYQAIYAASHEEYSSQSASSLGLLYSGYVYKNGYVASSLNFNVQNKGTLILNDKIAGDSNVEMYKWNSSSKNDSTLGKYVYTYNYLDKDNNIADTIKYYSSGANDSTQ